MKNVIIVIACLGFLGLVGYGFYNQSSIRKEAGWKDEQETMLDKFFTDQMKGNPVSDYFCSGSDPKSLYAVKTWTLVDQVVYANGRDYTFRIASSTKAGLAVENLWLVKVKMDGSKKYCIVEFREKQ